MIAQEKSMRFPKTLDRLGQDGPRTSPLFESPAESFENLMEVLGKIRQLEEPLGTALETVRWTGPKTFEVDNTIKRFC
jgi:hypothetical protein